MTVYQNFLAARSKMERAAGRMIIEAVEAGKINLVRTQYVYGAEREHRVKGSDMCPATLVSLSRCARARKLAALRVLNAKGIAR